MYVLMYVGRILCHAAATQAWWNFRDIGDKFLVLFGIIFVLSHATSFLTDHMKYLCMSPVNLETFRQAFAPAISVDMSSSVWPDKGYLTRLAGLMHYMYVYT